MRKTMLLKLSKGALPWKSESRVAILVLGQLIDEGLAHHDLRSLSVTLTEAGKEALAGMTLQVVQAPTRPAAIPKKERSPYRYYGEELLGTCHRQGAYDFLAKPSRTGDVLQAHPTAYLAEVQA